MTTPHPDPDRFPRRWSDLSSRAARLGGRWGSAAQRSQRVRVERWHGKLAMIVQCAIVAGAAWFVATHLLHHSMAILAPMAALVALANSFGQRLGKAVEVAVGVTVGVFVGEAFVAVVGTGTWQVVLAVLVAMSIATWLGDRSTVQIQAGVQALVVVTILPAPGQGMSRWVDALVGCGLALLVAAVVPTSTIRRPRPMTAAALRDAADLLRELRAALLAGDEAAARQALTRARGMQQVIDQLQGAASDGMAIVRYSPFMRRQLGRTQALADLVQPLDRMQRNLRVLSRRGATAIYRGEDIPAPYLDLMGEVADAIDFAAGELFNRRLPTAARGRVVALGEASARYPMTNQLSSMMIIGQLRSILVDLLELCGDDYLDAREQIPDMV